MTRTRMVPALSAAVLIALTGCPTDGGDPTDDDDAATDDDDAVDDDDAADDDDAMDDDDAADDDDAVDDDDAADVFEPPAAGRYDYDAAPVWTVNDCGFGDEQFDAYLEIHNVNLNNRRDFTMRPRMHWTIGGPTTVDGRYSNCGWGVGTELPMEFDCDRIDVELPESPPPGTNAHLRQMLEGEFLGNDQVRVTATYNFFCEGDACGQISGFFGAELPCWSTFEVTATHAP